MVEGEDSDGMDAVPTEDVQGDLTWRVQSVRIHDCIEGMDAKTDYLKLVATIRHLLPLLFIVEDMVHDPPLDGSAIASDELLASIHQIREWLGFVADSPLYEPVETDDDDDDRYVDLDSSCGE